MIAQSYRFHGYGSLRGVYQRGQGVRGSLISAKFAVRGANKAYRVAVVVSKKVHKSAVVRNRIRRRIYELIRTSEHQLAPGTDVVFTVFSEQVAELDSAKLQQMVDGLLRGIVEQDNPTKEV